MVSTNNTHMYPHTCLLMQIHCLHEMGKKYKHSHAWISAHTFNSQRVNVGVLLWAPQQYNVGVILGGTAPVGACSSVPEYCPVKSHKGHQWVWWLGNLATCQRHRAKLWQKDKTSVFDVNIANPGRVRPLHLLRSPSLHVFDRAALQRHFDRHSRNKRKRGRGEEEAEGKMKESRGLNAGEPGDVD